MKNPDFCSFKFRTVTITDLQNQKQQQTTSKQSSKNSRNSEMQKQSLVQKMKNKKSRKQEHTDVTWFDQDCSTSTTETKLRDFTITRRKGIQSFSDFTEKVLIHRRPKTPRVNRPTIHGLLSTSCWTKTPPDGTYEID